MTFSKNQLQKHLELEREKNNTVEDSRVKQVNDAQSLVYEEKRRIEDLQLKYEQAMRKAQRELTVLKEEAIEKDSIFE